MDSGGSIMIPSYRPADEADFFDVGLAKWVLGVLAMLIAVVGRESLVGLILRQTRSEITGLVRDEERGADSTRDAWYMNN
jgi:hypothetical protein